MNCLIDTGSQATIVNLSLVKDLKLERSIRRTDCVLSSFTKDKIKTAGEIDLNLTIAGVCASHSCIVVAEDMECNVLLGMDFMTEHDISIHTGSSTITSPNGSSPFLPPPTPMDKRAKVRATSTVVIPPNTVMFVKGSLELPDKTCLIKKRILSGYLEPYENLAVNDGLFAAGALMYSEQGEVPIRILNPTDDSIVIHKRKLLGFMRSTGNKQNLQEIRVQRIAAGKAKHPSSQPAERVGTWTKKELFEKLRLDEVQIPREDRERLKSILWERKECFSKHGFDLGTCNFFEAEIKLKSDAVPQYVPPIPTPYKRREEMNKHLEGMEKAGIIEETRENLLWNSRVFLVPKPNQKGKFRFVADFRALNQQCLPSQYQLPNINHVADRIGGAKWYSTFDLSKSFYQVKYDDSSRMLTAFTANNKRYIFNRMVMGHLTSSSQFANMMDRLLANIPLDQLCYFLDDLCLASNCVKTHLDRLEIVLDKLLSSNMKLMPDKCEFLKKEVKFVGLTISQSGIRINEDRIKAVKELAPPRSLKEAQQVMGFLSYNRKFVRKFAELAKPIYSLIDKKKKFSWTQACQRGFEEIKKRIAEGITLTIPQVDDPHKSYVVTMDASLDGYGAELSQLQDGERKTIAFFSKRVPEHKRQWSQSKLEFEALVEAIEHWAIFLKGTEFLVKTDCLSLVALEKLFAKSNATMIRRLNKLADYTFSLQHLAGEMNSVADFLSRYVHKKREHSRATQTEELKSDTPDGEIVNCNLVTQNTGTPNLEQTDITNCDSVTVDDKQDCTDHEDNPLIPDKFYTDEYIKLPDRPRMSTPLMTEVDLTSEVDCRPCVCNHKYLTHKGEEGNSEIKVNLVARNSSVTQQLNIPTLIDLEKIKKAQEEDVILKTVRRWVDKDERPTDLQTYRSSGCLLNLYAIGNSSHFLRLRMVYCAGNGFSITRKAMRSRLSDFLF